MSFEYVSSNCNSRAEVAATKCNTNVKKAHNPAATNLLAQHCKARLIQLAATLAGHEESGSDHLQSGDTKYIGCAL